MPRLKAVAQWSLPLAFAIDEGPTSIEGNPYRRSARKTFVSAGRSRSGIDDFAIVTSAARGGNNF
jgi:hypothetical protein